jgi:hypothetical protein
MPAAPSCLGVAVAKTEVPALRTTAGPPSTTFQLHPPQSSVLKPLSFGLCPLLSIPPPTFPAPAAYQKR